MKRTALSLIFLLALSSLVFAGGFDNDPTDISGNAATASALAANGANCSAGSFPLGVDASGAAESCTALSASNAGTATALTANGANCSAGQFPLGVDASGAAEGCSANLNSPSLGTTPLTTTYTAGTGGTTAGLLVKLDSSGNVVTASASDVGIIGIAISSVSATASVEVATRGIIPRSLVMC